MVQGPGAGVLSEHHLLRPRGLRRGRGGAGVFRQAGRAAQRGRGCAAGRADPAAVGAGPGRRPGLRGRAVELGARRHGGDRGALRAGPAGAGVPADHPARCCQHAEPDHRAERTDRAAGDQRAARDLRHQRADAEHRGSADHHHHQPAGAGRRGRRRRRVHGGPGPRHAHGDRVDRPEDRRGGGLLRRHRRRRVRLRSGRSAHRLVVQGLRVGRGAGAGHGPGLSGGQLAGDGQRHRDLQRRGQQLRHLQHRRGVEAFAEHQLLPADAGAGERSGRCGRRRAPRRHRRELPRGGAHAVRGRPGRPAQQRRGAGAVPVPGDRHGLGVRHAGRVGRLPQAALRAEGRQRRGHRAVRRQPGGQHRRAAHREGRGRQRHRRDAADRRLLRRARAGRGSPVGRQDRHQPAR